MIESIVLNSKKFMIVSFQVLSGIILFVPTDLVLINRSVRRNDMIEAVRPMIG